MSNVLKERVLVLNRLWQAIDTIDVETAFCNITRGVATAIDVGPDHLRPVTLAEWLTLPVRPEDKAIGTTHGAVRVPTIIACVSYDKMPKKTPKLTAKNIRKRDGNRCQYTNRVLGPGEGNLDHVNPRHRGGKNSWDNLVWADRKINEKKANRTPEEAGLRLIRKPTAPREQPAILFIEPDPTKPEWKPFLIQA